MGSIKYLRHKRSQSLRKKFIFLYNNPDFFSKLLDTSVSHQSGSAKVSTTSQSLPADMIA
jgi:hypothetical protein